MSQVGASGQFNSELLRLFDQSADLFCVVGYDGYFKHVNSTYARTIGHPKEELLAMPYLNIAHPDDVESIRQAVAGLAQEVDVRGLVTRLVCADGSLRWIDWNAISPPGEAFIYSFGRDITENLRATTELTVLLEEHAALRRVATLVAEGAASNELFSAVSAEVSRLFRLAPDTPGGGAVVRFDPGPELVLVGISAPVARAPVESRWDPPDMWVSTRVMRTGRPARLDESDLLAAGGSEADWFLGLGIRSMVGSPIVVNGRLWGAVTANATEPLPLDAADRLEKFTELIATAIANADSRAALRELADEQAALRRIAELVAAGAPPMSVFAAVAEEVGQLLAVDRAFVTRLDDTESVTVLSAWTGEGTWTPSELPQRRPAGPITRRLHETHAAVRFDEYMGDPTAVYEDGVRSVVAAPITVSGKPWGFVMVASVTERPPPPSTEARLSDFTELVGTAIANAESLESLARVAEEQAALRRIATLVARGADPSDVFESVINESADLVGADGVLLSRYEPDAEMRVVASCGPNSAEVPPDTQIDHKGENVATIVRRSERPWRMEEYDPADPSPMGELARRLEVRSGVGAPVFVGGRLWGVLLARWSRDEPPPPDAEERMVKFAQLIDTAIANAEARREVTRLANEQSALRRVATLVAKEASPEEVFAQVAEEAARLLGGVDCGLMRDLGSGSATVVAASGRAISATFPVGSMIPLDEAGVVATVIREGRPARVDDYENTTEAVVAEGARAHGVHSAVGSPIVVGGGTWGAIVLATSGPLPCPPHSEPLLARFADLVATAISNSSAREEVERLADEQAALRRIATLVAQSVSPSQIFDAVSEEVVRVFRSSAAAVVRFDGEALVHEGVSEALGAQIEVGTRWPLDDVLASSKVYRTGHPAQRDGLVDGVRRRGGRGRQDGFPVHRQQPDQCAGQPVGDDRGDFSGAPSGRHRATPGELHGAGGDGDRQRGHAPPTGGVAPAHRHGFR